MSTLWWPEEIRAPENVMRPSDAEVDAEQFDLTVQLVEAMAEPWGPDQYTDEYQRQLGELIEAKAQGTTINYAREEPAGRGRLVDLDSALRESLQSRLSDRRAEQAGREAGLRGGPPTKKNLLERAKELGIRGRTKMSRAELAAAVDQARAS